MSSVTVAVYWGECTLRSALKYIHTSTHSDSAPFISVESDYEEHLKGVVCQKKN